MKYLVASWGNCSKIDGMSKVAVIGMMVGGAFIFIIIVSLIVVSFSGPAQAPSTGVGEAVVEGEDEVVVEGEEESFSGGVFGGGQEPSGYSGEGSFFDESEAVSTDDSAFGELPVGELRDDYVTVPEDSDNNGFLDFQRREGLF